MSTVPPMPRPLVVFDLGGVVVRICRSWEQACNAAGVPYHPEVLDPARVSARAGIVHRHEVGEITSEAFFGLLSESTGGLYTPGQVRAVHMAWILEEYPGVGALIDDLHARGVATGVLSNTNAAHWTQLAGTPVTPAKFPTPSRVGHLHASHLLGLAKPDPRIYDAFARRAVARPESIIFFDDLESNILAARACGWNARVIDHAGDPAAQMRAELHRLGVL